MKEKLSFPISVSILTKLLVDFFLYSNVWIALAATALTVQTIFLLTGTIVFSPLLIFVFCATLFIYAIHRIVGLKKVADFQDQGRYLVIATFRSHIILYAILGGTGVLISIWWLNYYSWGSLIIPGLLSLGYVLPILNGKRRLRDLNWIKIFLIALVWAWITVLIPTIELQLTFNSHTAFLFLERLLFVFAITIPFDIRDLQIDQHNSVQTLPASIGIQKSKLLAILLLLLMCSCVFINQILGFYHLSTTVALSCSVLLTIPLIWYSDQATHDYYFSGLLDGTMILQTILLLGGNALLNGY